MNQATDNLGGSESPKAINSSIEHQLQELANVILASDHLARIQAKPLLIHLIENPEQAEKIIPRLVALLDGPPLTTETKDFIHAKQPS
jgi:hypothetical protein